MQFQLIGTIKYWEEIHNDGMPGSEQILEEFEADDVRAAVKKAHKLALAIASQYPISTTHGCKEFGVLNVELRTIKSVWNGSITLKEIVEQQQVTKTIKHLSGSLV